MSEYLLDTNHASPFLEGETHVIDRSLRVGGEMRLCQPVVGELWQGVFGSGRVPENRLRLERALRDSVVLPFDADAAVEYGRISHALRLSGKKIPQIDRQIAAIARSRDLVVLTADRHFAFIDGIYVENWLR